MTTQNILVRILAALFACAAMQLSAEAGVPTIKLVTTFQVDPDQNVYTVPRSINSNGDIAGYTDDVSQLGATQGFVRFRNRTYLTIIDPNERPGSTTVQAINDLGLIAGDYYGRPNGRQMTLGFFLSGDTYTDFVVPGADNTYLRALNNAGNFAGTADFQNDLSHPYISVRGNVTLFSLPGSFTAVGGMNNLNQVVGSYSDEGGNHGYIRNADGTLTFPIDYPGALHTFLYGINDKGWMVGSYLDTEDVYHGLFLSSPRRFIVFDLPPGRFTELAGINNQGMICGDYEDNGVVYGLVARVTLTPAD